MPRKPKKYYVAIDRDTRQPYITDNYELCLNYIKNKSCYFKGFYDLESANIWLNEETKAKVSS